jgi:hypothetical protein
VSKGGSGNGRVLFALAVATLCLGACDVTNPGQILDSDLSSPEALRILVNGMAGDFQQGLDNIGWDNAVLTGDLTGTSAYLSRQRHWAGDPQPEDAEDYNTVYEAEWVASHGIERMKEVLGPDFDSSPLAAEASLWAGFANRLLGETMCHAVIDGGAPQPREVYFDRAETFFTQAIDIAEAAGSDAATIRLAALGGRASVRVIKGDWAGAVADAGEVPTDFAFYSQFSSTSGRENNTIWDETQRRVNLNVKYTFFEDYYQTTDDPRTPWHQDPDLALAADGHTEQLIQGKYNDIGADIALTKGAEMRLIEAENLIRSGQWEDGMAAINALRTAAGAPTVNAADETEAMDHLRKERAIVMWLETRRGGDLLRFGGDPASDPILAAMAANAPDIPLEGRAICMPYSLTMLSTNPNLGN